MTTDEMSVEIFDKQNIIKLNIKKVLKYIPLLEKKLYLLKNLVYNIIFVDDREIKKLNKKFRYSPYPTDVLSFKYSKNSADIFISVETAKNNAKFYRQDFYTEILRLIIHGVLHSLGYMDYTEKSKKIMWKKQEEILKIIRDNSG
ncbi:MAG: rRNA maturation RNase YbeY [Elusimicrobiota bacterium]